MRRAGLLLGLLAIVGLLAAADGAGAATGKLKLKRVDTSSNVSSRSADYALRYTSSQRFYMQIRDGVESSRSGDGATFKDVISKELDEYVSEHPFRGVATLGSQRFGFVLDTAEVPEEDGEAGDEPEEEAEDEKSSLLGALVGAVDPDRPQVGPVVRYNRLYFDLNGNGDLTDDAVIEAADQDGRVRYPPNYAAYSFPRVDLTIDVDGSKVDYAFTFSITAQASTAYQYAYASLNPAVYRQGEIEVGGKTRQVVLVDYNSNGRFDDVFAINEDVRMADGSVYPSPGDMLYLDLGSSDNAYRYGYDPTANKSQHYLSKVVNLDGTFYDVEVTTAGDRITMEPSKLATGFVTNPTDGYRALVYGEQGFLKIVGDEKRRAPLPVGKWKLLSYTIDQTGFEKPEEEAETEEGDKAQKSGSLLESLVGVFTSTTARATVAMAPRFTMVSARGTTDYKAVEVRKGQTAVMPFGPPFKPEVSVSLRSSETASLAMSLVGSGGARCSNLLVEGRRPPDPTFTIKTSDGEEVAAGKFKYG